MHDVMSLLLQIANECTYKKQQYVILCECIITNNHYLITAANTHTLTPVVNVTRYQCYWLENK